MQPNPVSLSTIVLAGGLSTRMGQDKALIPIEGVSLIQRTCEIALGCSDRVYVVTPWPGRYQPIVDQRIDFILETPAPGAINSQTPLRGFLQGLQQTQTDWVLLLACDLPRLQASVLQRWICQLPTADPKAIALLPYNPEGWWEPLCGFYSRRCLPELQSFLEAGGRSFWRWLNNQPVQALPLDDWTMLLNCNTPEDLAKLRQINP